MNEAYSKADRLKNWYKKIRIDSFSKGSVLVDYFVELADVPRDINTQEIKQMFHEALDEVPMTLVPLRNKTAAPIEADLFDSVNDVKPVRSNYVMGKFILDPISTDFIGKINSSDFDHENVKNEKHLILFSFIFFLKQLFQNNELYQRCQASSKIH